MDFLTKYEDQAEPLGLLFTCAVSLQGITNRMSLGKESCVQLYTDKQHNNHSRK